MKPLLQNGFLRLTKRIILGFGIFLALFGLIALGIELWRTFTIAKGDIRWPYIFLALGLFLAGLGLIQTQNPMQFIRMFRAYLEDRAEFRRFQLSSYRGGRRYYDPPPETAPEALPPESWPKVDASWRQPTTKRSPDD